eukprot:TRINITY_DN6762_c0_g2_i1.p1 TRINITY_DN6762_c0_g2~~TRINITY_DN6762_c0_g2_i1.p1  ORF type:complete len:396 (-),score=65.49 TRINITY_DN6762_c0_g2_i1:591-1778(-)
MNAMRHHQHACFLWILLHLCDGHASLCSSEDQTILLQRQHAKQNYSVLNPSGCFEPHNKPPNASWTMELTRAYMDERRALRWKALDGSTKREGDFGFAYCPDAAKAADRTMAFLNSTDWPATEIAQILDSALKGLHRDEGPLLWQALVEGLTDKHDVLTSNFLCNLRREGLLSRLLLLVEDPSVAHELNTSYPEMTIMHSPVLLNALRRSVAGGHFDPTGYRLLMHRLLLERGYRVVHLDSDIHFAFGPMALQEVSQEVAGFDMAGMNDDCEFLEINGGFQYWMPTEGSLKALATAVGMRKPTYDKHVLFTANDQWALNCGLVYQAAVGAMKVKVLPTPRFKFQVKHVTAADVGTDADKMLVLHTGGTYDGHHTEKWKELLIWELDDDGSCTAHQ